LRSLDAVLHCPHFGRCGGCSLLDQPIADQLAQKQRHAATLLGPWLDGVVPETSLPPRPPRHDRTTILYPAQLVHRQLQLGIYRRGSHDVEPITDCRIQHKALTTFGVRAGDVLRDLKLPVYLESSGNCWSASSPRGRSSPNAKRWRAPSTPRRATCATTRASRCSWSASCSTSTTAPAMRCSARTRSRCAARPTRPTAKLDSASAFRSAASTS
jgi:hypothetical protein